MNVWNGTPRLDGVRVLLVEGAPQVREVVADVLGQCGAHVTAVDSAVDGLAILKQDRPDALVSSLSMPDNDGYWLIREVRKLPPDQGGDVPAAAFTGLTTAEDRLAILQAGFQYHVPKPVTLSRLVKVVALLTLKKSRAGEQPATTDLSSGVTITTTELVTELRSSRTDLARIVEAAHRNKLSRLVVPAQSVRAWEQREPGLWPRVRNWLEAHSITVVEV